MTICTAHRREHTSNVLPLTVSLLASPFSQVVSEHCETTDTGLCITTKCHVNLFVYNNNNNNMQYACLLPQLSPGTFKRACHATFAMASTLLSPTPGTQAYLA